MNPLNRKKLNAPKYFNSIFLFLFLLLLLLINQISRNVFFFFQLNITAKPQNYALLHCELFFNEPNSSDGAARLKDVKTEKRLNWKYAAEEQQKEREIS